MTDTTDPHGPPCRVCGHGSCENRHLHTLFLDLVDHPSETVRRHAIGTLRALERYTRKLIAEQERRMNPNARRCKACGLHPASCICERLE